MLVTFCLEIMQHSLKVVRGPELYADISFVTDTGKGWHRRRWRWTGWMGKVPREQREVGLADPWPRGMVHQGLYSWLRDWWCRLCRVFPMCGWLKPKWRHWFCNLWGVALHKSIHVVQVSFILEYVQHINPHKSHMNIPIYINLACTEYPCIKISSFLGVLQGHLGFPSCGPGRRRRSMSLPEKPTKSIEEKPMDRQAKGSRSGNVPVIGLIVKPKNENRSCDRRVAHCGTQAAVCRACLGCRANINGAR